MKYRYAKKLHAGDQVVKKDNQELLKVSSIEVYGQLKTVRINCLDNSNNLVALFHNEVE